MFRQINIYPSFLCYMSRFVVSSQFKQLSFITLRGDHKPGYTKPEFTSFKGVPHPKVLPMAYGTFLNSWAVEIYAFLVFIIIMSLTYLETLIRC